MGVKKKIVTITMVKNEADIIEYFIRYTLNFADEMIFIDNGCADGTIEIINRIREEGYKIRVYNEAHVFYEQFKLDNKYIQLLAKEDFDLIIPLDADEFLASNAGLIEQLNCVGNDKITLVKWRTFCLNDDKKGSNLFERNNMLRVNESTPFTKVILPVQLIRSNKFLVSMGHHNVIGDSLCKVENDEIFVAHFPVRSEEQIKLKIYQGVISQLMSSYRRVVAFHWKELFDDIKRGKFDLVRYSREYALTEERSTVDYIEQPLDISWCNNCVERRYVDYIDNNITDLLFLMNQIICVRNIIDEESCKDKKHILIYGTGNTVENSIGLMDVTPYSIIAYVDSDESRMFGRFNGKIIIAPQFIKYVEWDLIVIASIYEKEIRETLRVENIDDDRIIGFEDFVCMCINNGEET